MIFSFGNRLTVAYYQRLVLDRAQRFHLRNMGALVCAFGLVVSVGIASATVSSPFVSRLSDLLFGLLVLAFALAFLFGFTSFIVQLVRGKSFNSWKTWRNSNVLGPVSVYPSITPQMEKEAKVYSIAFCGLLLILVIIAYVWR